MSKMYLGVDIGGTAVKLGLVDENGQVVSRAERSVSFDGYKTPILDTVTAAIRDFIAPHDAPALAGIGGRIADLTVTVAAGEYRSFTVKLAADAAYHTRLTYDPYTSLLTLDRSCAGSRADIVHTRSCKVRSQNGALKLRILLDKNSVEVFVNDGEQTMTAWIYTPQSADGITFAANGQATITVEQFELNL